jgi:hypothetical protein
MLTAENDCTLNGRKYNQQTSFILTARLILPNFTLRRHSGQEG